MPLPFRRRRRSFRLFRRRISLADHRTAIPHSNLPPWSIILALQTFSVRKVHRIPRRHSILRALDLLLLLIAQQQPILSDEFTHESPRFDDSILLSQMMPFAKCFAQIPILDFGHGGGTPGAVVRILHGFVQLFEFGRGVDIVHFLLLDLARLHCCSLCLPNTLATPLTTTTAGGRPKEFGSEPLLLGRSSVPLPPFALVIPLPQNLRIVNSQFQKEDGEESMEEGEVGAHPLDGKDGEGGEDVTGRAATDEEAVVGVGGSAGGYGYRLSSLLVRGGGGGLGHGRRRMMIEWL
mmetsp:Transcript_40298/g.86972  ORF Transcript_40298/g.86972 Transcript_40298/m.86972 type:complete len:293 (+) Transcript_40298:896-1774(+)